MFQGKVVSGLYVLWQSAAIRRSDRDIYTKLSLQKLRLPSSQSNSTSMKCEVGVPQMHVLMATQK